MKHLKNSFLVKPYSGPQQVILYLLAAAWIFSIVFFYRWWFDPGHFVTTTGFFIITLALFWITLIPAYFVFFVLRARVPNPLIGIPSGWRVAMVVTKVPSEPLSMVQETIRGMLRQRYPHDVWLADEAPDPETIEWCRQNGVRISSRQGVAEYHRNDWPKRTRSKEGNLAFFYDRLGYENYDFVIQLDADHIPEDGYLEEMLRPFADPRVGYVSAPSICDRNAATSWSARSRLYAEGLLHGVLQAGYTNGFAPLCIGSHYAVRTKALREIGGLGPELAEDHSTTLMMNAAGWRGVHAISAKARGYGPEGFQDFAIQEFQWARSLTTILLEYTPSLWRRLPFRLKVQFAFSELWYPLFSVSMLVFLLLPAIALYAGTPWVRVIYLDFLWRMALVILPLLLMNLYLVKLGWARPTKSKVLSWETVLFLFVRWPWSLMGCLVAVRDRAKKRRAAFRITRKPGAGGESAWSPRFSLPYLGFSVFAVLPVFVVTDPGDAAGYIIFSVINAFLYAWAFAAVSLFSEGRPAPKGKHGLTSTAG